MTRLFQLAEVLEGVPAARDGFMEFGGLLRRILPLMKAKRMLSEEEIIQLERDCKEFGVVFPRVFKGNNITPKLHELIFYLPEMAREKGTVGGLREEALESKHAAANSQRRRLACMRMKEERLRMMLQADELNTQQKTPEMKEPLFTRRKRKAVV